MDFLDFLHEYREEKSETFTEFLTNFVLSRNKKIIRWCAVVAKNQRKITYDKEFSKVKSMGLKYMNFWKGIKLDFICMKMKLMKNKKYLQQKFSWNVLIPETTADFTSTVGKSYVPFTCKFPTVMHFVPILSRWCKSKTNFYVSSYDKSSLKFCASFRFFLEVFMEKFQKNPLSELCEKRNSLFGAKMWRRVVRDITLRRH